MLVELPCVMYAIHNSYTVSMGARLACAPKNVVSLVHLKSAMFQVRKWTPFRCASDRKCTRCFAWQAQYFVTVWPGREELTVFGFFSAQVNTARFAWHLQYAGTFDWLLSAWRVELRGRHNTSWRSDLGGRNWKCLVCVGAQVNTGRFAWHLQYAGTFMIGYFQADA